MDEAILQESANELRLEWNLQLPEILSEEALLQLLANKIVSVLEQGPEVFYQLMYRLDISEGKLNVVLLQEQIPLAVARLVYDRQLQKIKSRAEHRHEQKNNDAELQW